ncbi:MAG TPA: hypothetical protein PK231_02840 [Acidocella sp.]|jgi:hypothetical protein|nr:MAG: hypothetical protein B7Z77_09530 [Acidocella sp. 20-58-15]HQT38335.1 hypothetical protein [Acidocella sp.]
MNVTARHVLKMSYRQWAILSAFGLICGLIAAQPALAQTGMTPSKQNELLGATTGLGSSHRFPTIADARNQCDEDTIVWGSGITLTYMLPGAPGYGKTQPGFYACKSEADSAGFSPAS